MNSEFQNWIREKSKIHIWVHLGNEGWKHLSACLSFGIFNIYILNIHTQLFLY